MRDFERRISCGDERIFDETTKLINAVTSIAQPNWFDCLQFILTALGLAVSIWAVITAINIPKKIADNQDKIALFDKRIRYYQTCYTIIMGCCVSENAQQVEENLKKQGLEFVCYDFNGAKFLFDQETSDFICEVFKIWINYSASSYIKNYDDNSATNELYND